MNAGHALRLVLGDLRHDLPRSLLTTLNLSLVMTIHLAVAGLSGALTALKQDTLTDARNLLVISADVLDPTDSDVGEAQLVAAAGAAGEGAVLKTSPLFLRHLRIEGHILQVAAAPPGDFEDVYHLRLEAGRWPAGLDEIAVSGSALAVTGQALDGALVIYGSPFRIVGRVDVPGNRAGVWMSAAAGQALFGAGRGFQIGVLQLAADADPAAVQARLETEARLQGLAVYQEQQFSARFALSVEAFERLAQVFNLVSLLVVGFGAYNVTNLGLAERSAELGMLRAVGVSGGALHAILAARSLLLGLVAFAAGWTAYTLYIRFGQGTVMLHVNRLDLALGAQQSLASLGLCLAFSGAGALLPALGLMRRSSAELLQEGV